MISRFLFGSAFGIALLLTAGWPLRLTAQAPSPVPFVNLPLVPASAAPGGAQFTLAVNGTGFVHGSVVNWNGSSLATTFVSSSQLTAIVPASEIATATTASVTVSNPPPGGGTSFVAFFEVTNPVPNSAFVSSVLPLSPSATGISIPPVTGDFNGDGKLDLAFIGVPPGSTSNNSNWVCIALGIGDGTFHTPICSASPVGGGQMLAADFNNDGKLDLAISVVNSVHVLLGNGDGTFQAAKTSVTGSLTNAFVQATADLNGDGKLDLVAINNVSQGNGFSVILGNGDGTFQSPASYSTSVDNLQSVVIGDFNRDGKLDLVFKGFPQIYFLAGNGDGTFQAPLLAGTALDIGGYLVAADLNGDGKLDLILTDSIQPAIEVSLGNGDGTFQPGVSYSTSATQSCLTPAFVIDLNGDGILDVAVCQSFAPPPLPFPIGGPPPPGAGPTTVSVMLGRGDGTFQTPTNLSTPNGAEMVYGVTAGDLNGDGKADIVGVMVGSNPPNPVSIVVLLQVLPGSFPQATVSPINITFVQQAIGSSSSPQVIKLANTGNSTLSLSSVVIGGLNPGDFAEVNTCGTALIANASCQINVTFIPTAPRTSNAMVIIMDNAPDNPQTVALTGVGVAAPILSFSPTSINFGNQLLNSSNAAQSISLTNGSTAALNITSIAITGASSGDFAQTNTCGASVAAGTNCTISVTFNPTATGNRTANVTITDDAAGSPQSIALTGTGTDFSIGPASGGSTSATVAAGQTATYNLQVLPVSGFNGTVTLTCSGAPGASTCSVSPVSVPPSGSSNDAFTVTVSNTSNVLVVPWPESPLIPMPPALSITVLMLLVLWKEVSKKGSLKALLSATAVLLICAMLASGCAGGGGNGGNHLPPTNATLTISGTSGSVKHQLSLSLTVDH